MRAAQRLLLNPKRQDTLASSIFYWADAIVSDDVVSGVLPDLFDLSGNGIHASALVDTRRPVYTAADPDFNGHASLLFDGSDDYLSVTSYMPTIEQPFTVVAVARNTDLSVVGGTIFDGGSTTPTSERVKIDTNRAGGKIGIYAGTVLESAVVSANLNTNLYYMEVNGASSKLERNTREVITGNVGTSVLRSLNLGAGPSGASPFKGKIGLLRVMPGLLAPADKTAMVSRLIANYAIGVERAPSALEALVERMTVKPDTARQYLMASLIQGLIDDGIWPLLGALYINAAHTEQAALLNWIENRYNETAVNAPTFTADRGFTGNGTTSYLDTNFLLTAAVTKAQQDSNHLGVWLLTNSTASMIDCGNSKQRINARSTTATSAGVAAHSTTVDTIAVASSAGWSCATRDNSVNFRFCKDGAAPSTLTRVSSAPNSTRYFALAVSNSGNNPGSFSTRQQAVLHFGAALTDEQMASFFLHLQTYLTGVGAI